MFRTKKIERAAKFLLLAGFFPMFSGCQKDDICPAGSETTPLLIIEFYDAQDPSRLKAVQNLVVQANGEDILLGPVNTNSISIPLRTDETVTEYSFIAQGEGDTENEDIISFSYDPAPEYLNRACGYKINFRNIDANTHQDENNWIVSETILQESVENETEAHISITH